MSRRYLTHPEAAAYLRRTVNAMYQDRQHGRPPGALGVLIGGKLLYDIEELDRWVDAQRAEQRAEAEERARRLEVSL